MSMKLSQFGERFTRETGTAQLMGDLGRAIAEDPTALLLGGGNPGTVPEMVALFQRRLHEIGDSPDDIQRMMGNYAHPRGELGFRKSLARLLARKYGWPLTADNIALTSGSQTGFFQLFNMLAGDFADGSRRRILLPMTPEYAGYNDIGLVDDLYVAHRPEIEERPGGFFKYRVNFDSLSIDDDVAAVCVSRPTNPTGNIITDGEMHQLDAMARAAGVPFIIDNAYGVPFPRIIYSPATPLWNENVILCMSLSKLGLPGIRTGIVIAREELIEALGNMTAVQSLTIPSTGAVFIQPWVESGEIEDISRDVIQSFYQRKMEFACDVVRREFRGVPCKIHSPEGAFFLWLWFPGLPITSEELYLRLKARNVLVMSGHRFFPGLREPWRHVDECLRLSYAQEDRVVEEGMRIIADEVRGLYSGRAGVIGTESVRAGGRIAV